MTSFVKTSTAAGRVLLAMALVLGHFAFCACPAYAGTTVEVVEPANSGCCTHEETPESQSCCGDDTCAAGESDAPEENASTVPEATVSVAAQASMHVATHAAVSPVVASGLMPGHFNVPTSSTSTTLLFCVSTQ